MRATLFSIVFLLFSSVVVFGQKSNALLIGLYGDLIKSDNAGFFEKLQTGVEANYYFSRKFSLSAGIEEWTGDNDISLILGTRWSPVDEAFFRVRGLIGERDLSIGAGWAKPLPNNFRIEAMSDFYFQGHVAIRAGIAYVIR
jgi:hypothetical protein